nr:Abi family protein [uncultured Anaerostipes sp.]
MDEKIFRDTRMQIGILKSRGVIIKNKRIAKQLIRNTNYYNLINGYKEPFLQPNTSYEKYFPGTTFEEIYALYEFDRKLRIITLEYILEIEKQVKSLIACCFSKVHGHKNYLKLENFDTLGQKKYGQVCNLLSSLYKKISLNIDKDLSVSHYVSGKNYIPLWVLVNTLSMGDISKFYSNMVQRERNDVARRLKWGVKEHQLASCLFFLSTIRNRCAHDERLYSYLSYVNLCNNKYFHYFHKTSNTNSYFAVMVAFKMLLSTQRYQTYHKQIESLFNELSSQLSTISIKKIRGKMGIPDNWRRLKTL